MLAVLVDELGGAAGAFLREELRRELVPLHLLGRQRGLDDLDRSRSDTEIVAHRLSEGGRDVLAFGIMVGHEDHHELLLAGLFESPGYLGPRWQRRVTAAARHRD